MLKRTFLLFLIGLTSSSADPVDVEEPSVTIRQGTLKGFVQTSLSGKKFNSFLGVRYAEPPIGNLRFRPPVPLENSNHTFEATQDGPACPQPNWSPISEDCLYLNVHTPKLPTAILHHRYPVIVYVHPGSLILLTGNSAYAGPHYLLDRNIVLVTFNYRLGALGYLSTGDQEALGNYGFKDQVQVLRWVRENIHSFGGDPSRVTLAGYSAGGLSVSLHLFSPMSRGLFHRVMMMSGSAFRTENDDVTNLLALAKKQARLVGCPDDTSANIVNCLREVPAEDLANGLPSFRVFGNDPQFFWQMVIEPDFGQERFLNETLQTSLNNGRVADVPMLTGITSDELIALAQPVVSNSTWLDVLNARWDDIAPFAFHYEVGTEGSRHISRELRSFYFPEGAVAPNSLEPLGEVYSDSLSGYSINRGARLLSRYLRSKVFYYVFAYEGRYTNFPHPEKRYVVHFDDMLYVFWNSLAFPKFNSTDPEARMVKTMMKIWSNFAYCGQPTCSIFDQNGLPHWSPFTEKNQNYIELGKTTSVKRNLYNNRYAKWDELFPLP